MRKKEQEWSVRLPPATLYLDDLEKIERLLKEALAEDARESGKEMVIKAEGYEELTGVEELREVAKRLPPRKRGILRDVTIAILLSGKAVGRMGPEGLVLQFSADGAWLRCSDTPALRGLSEGVREIVNDYRKPWGLRWVFSGVWGVLSLSCVGMVLWFVCSVLAFVIAPLYTTTVSVSFLLFLFGLLLCVVAVRSNFYSAIVPRWREETPGFWERNRDQIILNVSTTVIGAAIGVAGLLAVQWLFKEGDRPPPPSAPGPVEPAGGGEPAKP